MDPKAESPVSPRSIDYASGQLTKTRLSKLAVVSLIVALVDSPLPVLGLLQVLDSIERSIEGMPSWTPDRSTFTGSVSFAAPFVLIAMAVSVLVPLMAIVRILNSKALRGLGWAGAALGISVLGWGILFWLAFHFPLSGART